MIDSSILPVRLPARCNRQRVSQFRMRSVVWRLVRYRAALSVIPLGLGLQAAPPAVRELATDRPDVTESPLTVDRGFFQLESTFLQYTRDRTGATRTETWSWGDSLLKYGLNDRTDLQLGLTPYVRETETSKNTVVRRQGSGDPLVRLKYRLWNNDRETAALAVMPIVKIPTGTALSNDRWEGGAVVPVSWEASERWTWGAQIRWDRRYDDAQGKFLWEPSHTAVLGWVATEHLGCYVEYLGVGKGQSYRSYFSTGLTRELSPRVRLDFGVLLGLDERSGEFSLLTGISWKFR